MLGTTEAALVGQPAQVIYASSEDYRSLGAQVAECFARNQPYSGEWELLRADGSRFLARLRGQPVRWNDPEPGTIWTLNDITEESAARRALLWAATHDPLTGLANRTALYERLQQLFAHDPLAAQPAALLVLDLDHFKPINDQHGHAAGDAMLRAVAAAMCARVRNGDLVVRMGGDEFALLLERCPVEVAARVAEQVQQAVAAVRLPWNGELLALGCSIGVAALGPAHIDAEAWIAAADRACYGAKADGRGAVRDASAAPLRLVAGTQASVLA